MDFKPLTDDEMESQMNPFVDGQYDFRVENAIEKKSKSGNDMFELKMICLNEKGGSTFIYDWILPNHPTMGWKLKHLCTSVGLLEKYETGRIHPDDFIDKKGRLELFNKEEDGIKRRRVKDYLLNNEKPFNDDIPF